MFNNFDFGKIWNRLFSAEFRDSLLIASLLILPVLNLFRAVLTRLNPSPTLKLVIAITILFLHISIVLYVLLVPSAYKFLIRKFSQMLNFRLSQNALFILLWMEQFLVLHQIIAFSFYAPAVFFYCATIFSQSIFFPFYYSIILVGLVYIRLRRSFLNENAFQAAGIQSTEPYNWDTVITGLNEVLSQKDMAASVQTLPDNGLGSNFSGFSKIQISHKEPSLKTVVFPFFPVSQRRHLSWRAALGSFSSKLWTSAEQAPVAAVASAGTVIGSIVGGGYYFYTDQRESARKDREFDQKERQFAADLAKRKQELDQKERQFAADLAIRKQELDQKDRALEQNAQDLALRKEKIALKKKVYSDSQARELSAAEESSGSLSAAASKPAITLDPITGGLKNMPEATSGATSSTNLTNNLMDLEGGLAGILCKILKYFF